MSVYRNTYFKQPLQVCALLLGILLRISPAFAHGLNASYSTITVTQNRAQALFTFYLAEMDAHFHINTNGDAVISPEELQPAVPGIYDYIETHFNLIIDGARVPMAREDFAITQDAAQQEFLALTFSCPLRKLPSAIALALDLQPFETFGQNYTNLVKVDFQDRTQQAVLSIQNLRQEFSLSQAPSLPAQLWQFTQLGIKHIFLGYDHILFLLALIIIGGRLGGLIKIVTAFTIAHSITLILAALQIVTLPSRLIESAIALSIVYVAAENLFVNEIKHRWVLTFTFGLVHGFGFANVLREMGLPTQGLVSSLLAFNVGVELGQIAIVALLFPITLWLTKQRFRRQAIVVTSLMILGLGSCWFIERAFKLSFMPF